VPYNKRAISPCTPFHTFQYQRHLVSRQYHRQAGGTLGPHHLVQPRQIQPQSFAVQEQQSRQGLILRRRCYLARHGQMRQEGFDLLCSHLLRMPLAMKQDEPAHLLDILIDAPS
jgi:hypothetical protein